MTAATAPVEPEHEADDGLNFRCGSGERDHLGDGCPVWLPVRGLCEVHRQAIREHAVRARLTGIPRAWIEEYGTPAQVDDDVEHRAGIKRRIPLAKRAKQLARIVHDAGRRMSRDEAAAAMNMTTGGSISRVIRVAKDVGWITSHSGPNGGLSAGPTAPPPAA